MVISMMNDYNKDFTKEVKQELLTIVSKINLQIKQTMEEDRYTYDVDCNSLREIRGDIINSIDTISHMEYKELI